MAENYIGNAPGVVAAGPASQTEQEAATATDRFVTPAVQKSHPSAIKAWAYVTVTGAVPTIQASYNVSGIVRNSVSDYTLTFTTPFSSANYAAIVQARTVGTGSGMMVYGPTVKTASTFRAVLAADGTNTLFDPPSIDYIFMGDQ